MFLSVIENFIDQLETKMTNVDPSIVGQHVRPLKNIISRLGFTLIKNSVVEIQNLVLNHKSQPAM